MQPGNQLERWATLLRTEGVYVTNVCPPPPPPPCFHRQALELLAELQADGLAPNIVTYTTAVEACASAGKYRSAMALLEEMPSAGIEPTVVTFSTALK